MFLSFQFSACLLFYHFCINSHFFSIATDSSQEPDENNQIEKVEKSEKTEIPSPEENKYISNFMALSSSAIKKAQGTTAVQYLQVRAFTKELNLKFYLMSLCCIKIDFFIMIPSSFDHFLFIFYLYSSISLLILYLIFNSHFFSSFFFYFFS